MSLYRKVSITSWLSTKNCSAAYRGPSEFFIPELHSLLVWILFLKNSAQNRSIWLLSTSHSCLPGISYHRCFWIWSQTQCPFLLPTCTHSCSPMARCVWLARGTYQLRLAFLPTAKPHPWLSFHTCWHKLLHPRSRPAAPSHPCLGEWWLREVGYCSGSTGTKEKRKPFVLMPQSLCWEKGLGDFWFWLTADWQFTHFQNC